MTISLKQTYFVRSVIELSALPSDNGKEIVFAGRSNAGKSSALNSITGIAHLARTSKTPGRTQMINLFNVTENKRLVDLPGYGYAQVPVGIKKRWEKLLHQYFHTRTCLKGLCLIMDIRHPLEKSDQLMIAFAVQMDLPVQILLTKSDKLTRFQSLTALIQVQQKLQMLYPDKIDLTKITCQTFSAVNKDGLDTARKNILALFND